MTPMTLILLLGAATAPPEDVSTTRTLTLWVEPITAALGAAVANTYTAHRNALLVPLGVDVPLDDQWGLSFQATAFHADDPCQDNPVWGCRQTLWGGVVGIELLRKITGTQRQSGIWAGARLAVSVASETGKEGSRREDEPFVPGASGSIALGIDVGYEACWKRARLNVLLGGTLEYFFNTDSPLFASDPRREFPLPIYLIESPSYGRADGFRFAPNLSLLRLGVTL